MRHTHFQNSRIRIGWAKNDIANFERSANRFFQNTKPTIVREPEPDGIHELHKIRYRKKLPATLTQKTISATENLRSALDLLATEVMRLKDAGHNGKIYFPFCKASKDLKSRLNSGSCNPLPDDIKTLFASYEPYAGGSDLLWAINELANTSKHNDIVHVGFKSGIAMPELETTDAVTAPIKIIEGITDSAENEIVFARTQLGLKWKYRLKVTCGVSFGKIERIEGKEISPNLSAMVDAVTLIVNETEAKCREIGLVS
ncbi:MAG: hypothetical protein JWO20_1115 [Candidatus Angelobacter sp.]|nr:hypothetical protein [Candidatus Angelobacter sp.]